MRFRIAELLVVISVIGLASVSLKRSDPLFETIFFSFTVAFVSTSVLLTIGRDGPARAFWAGFAITSLCYLAFAHVPDGDEMVPRQSGPEITTQLLRLGYNWMHAGEDHDNSASQPGEYFSVADNPFDFGDDIVSTTSDNDRTPKETVEFPNNLTLIVGRGEQVSGSGKSSFMLIGHSLWALLLGWAGGHFTRAVYERSRRDRIGQAITDDLHR